MTVKDIPGGILINDNEIIWRYIDFASFYSLLFSKSLFLKRLDKHTDQYEGSLQDETIEELSIYRNSFKDINSEEVEKWVTNYIRDVDSFKSTILSNSWIISSHESFAMWKIYLKGSMDGVAIQTTVGNLRRALEVNNVEIHLGKVVYEPIPLKDINMFRVSTNKRKEYSFENELRIFMMYPKNRAGN